MNALVLCGGEGSRLGGDTEKPLRRVAGTPMVERVVAGLRGAAGVDAVHAAVSSNAPETAEHLRANPDVRVVETPGEGYVADLGTALDAVGTPVVTVAADLPLLTPKLVDRAIDAAHAAGDGDATADLAELTPARLKRRLGVSTDENGEADGVGDRDGAGDRNGDGDDECRANAWLPTGLNVVGDTGCDVRAERRSWDARLAVNVNYERDLAAAEALLGGER